MKKLSKSKVNYRKHERVMMNRQERRSARKDCADLQKFMEESKEQIYKAFKIPKGLMIDGKLDTSVIPKGGYCYGEKGTCPYWTLSENHPWFYPHPGWLR